MEIAVGILEYSYMILGRTDLRREKFGMNYVSSVGGGNSLSKNCVTLNDGGPTESPDWG